MTAYASIEEGVGTEDVLTLTSWVHLLSADVHSGQSPYAYSEHALRADTETIQYSYERYIRVRCAPMVGEFSDFRFWAPALADLPQGWTVRWGTVQYFDTPTNAPSSIATEAVPTSDPGSSVIGATPGTEILTDWIVLQAVADTAITGVGPILGFTTEGVLRPIDLQFAWTETET